VCVNRYAGWYGDGGHLDLVDLQTEAEVNRWHEKFARPVIISEYGAGALAGFHSVK
jgi:beta-glucuronidase